MVVLAIIGGLYAALSPAMFSKSNRSLKHHVRRLALLGKEVRNRALITKNTHRIVFDIQRNGVLYWADEAPGKILIDTSEDRKELIERRKNFTEREREQFEKKNPFTIVKRLFKKGPKALPPEIEIKKIELQGIKEGFEEGQVEIYFTPEGISELAVVQLQTKDKALKWTLVTSPLTGQIKTFDGHIDMEQLESRN